jgi:lipopolysaccharide/colanic/teichoic acid biosynthesis glycosyltransferase
MPRILEIALLILSAPFWGPLLLLVALLVRIRLGSPVLFCQVRPGRFGAPFELMKFRTMTDERDANGDLLPDEQRLTAFGRVLRSTSLDELPELLNVLRGEMSIVGPRPLLIEYLPLYSERHRARQDVRPGLTGWAQVCGRNSLSWSERFELDVWYVRHRTLWLDLRVLARTIGTVLSRRGVSAEGHATMSRFTGYPDPSD